MRIEVLSNVFFWLLYFSKEVWYATTVYRRASYLWQAVYKYSTYFLLCNYTYYIIIMLIILEIATYVMSLLHVIEWICCLIETNWIFTNIVKQ